MRVKQVTAEASALTEVLLAVAEIVAGTVIASDSRGEEVGSCPNSGVSHQAALQSKMIVTDAKH